MQAAEREWLMHGSVGGAPGVHPDGAFIWRSSASMRPPVYIQRSAKRLDSLLHRASGDFEEPAIGFIQFENEKYCAADREGCVSAWKSDPLIWSGPLGADMGGLNI